MRMTRQQYDQMMLDRARTSAPKPQQVAAVIEKLTGKQRLQALGRLPAGEMNATEKRYDEHLEQLHRAGEIVWRKFEGIKLRLAEKCFLTVDFAVMRADGVLEMHDVKGAEAVISDDARVKMRIAARLYPFVFKIAIPRKKKDGGGWDIREVG